MGGLLSVLWLAVLSLCAVLVPEQTGPAAEHPVLPDALHQRNVFVLDAPRRDVTSFDAVVVVDIAIGVQVVGVVGVVDVRGGKI